MATIGLDKLFYAKITEDEEGNETYATPVQMAKAMSADLSVEMAEATLYADDGAAEIVKEFKSGTLSLGIDDIGAALGNAVAPTVFVREQVNYFLHGHSGTDDLRLDFVAYIHIENSSIIFNLWFGAIATPQSGADAPNSEKTAFYKIVFILWVQYSVHTGIYPTLLFRGIWSETVKTPIVS